jgi:pimeloyl-ACP methyl ester carboxylesterase/uncharacterized protein (DUF952 family)
MTLPQALDGVPLRHARVAVGEVTLHVVEAGPVNGSPVLLLHGFPDFWYGWRHQLPALARAGYRVIAPDQRGYAGSDRPAGVAAYALPRLLADALHLLDALGEPGAVHVVGHDWGGAIAWALATGHPERVRSLTVINCPHPKVLRRALTSDPAQAARSWYMGLFQLPWLPERLLSGGRAAAALVETSAPGTFTPADLALYQEHVFATPEHLRGPVSWYRAARYGGFPKGQVQAPTRLLWGTADQHLGASLIEPTLARCGDGHAVLLEGVSHWGAVEAPELVNRHLADWLLDHGGPDRAVYKLVPRAAWEAVGDAWEGSADDRRDGFLHLSSAHQVEGTLTRHFAGQDDLLRLTVDPARLPPHALRFEPSRAGMRFPHLYGPLPRAAVTAVTALP